MSHTKQTVYTYSYSLKLFQPTSIVSQFQVSDLLYRYKILKQSATHEISGLSDFCQNFKSNAQNKFFLILDN